MVLLLIQPYLFDDKQITKASSISIGLFRIKSFLKEYGIETTIFDPNLSENPLTELNNLISRFNIKYVGFSTTLISIEYDLSLFYYLKKKFKNIIFIFGGHEVTIRGLDFIDYFSNQDWLKNVYFVMGEGENVILEIIKKSQLKKFDELNEISGLFSSNTKYCKMPTPLSQNEFNRFSMLLNYRDMYEKYDSDWIRIFSSRSCKYNCAFCSNSSDNYQIYKKQNVYLSNQNLIKTILNIISEFPYIEGIRFNDDDFLYRGHDEWLSLSKEIIYLKSIGKIPIDLKFAGQTRVDRLENEILKSLVSMGFKSIALGVESFSIKQLKEFNKNLSPSICIKVLNKLIVSGFNIHINIILFSPESSIMDLEVNLKYCLYFFKNGANVSITPYVYSLYNTLMYKKYKGSIYKKTVIIPNTNMSLFKECFIFPSDESIRKISTEIVKKAIEDTNSFIGNACRWQSNKPYIFALHILLNLADSLYCLNRLDNNEYYSYKHDINIILKRYSLNDSCIN